MKYSKLLFTLLLALLGFGALDKAGAQEVSVDFNTFYNDLGHYGRWVNHPQYGQVWMYNEPGFRPYYTNGHWDYTSYGWTWVSDYNWGWAPFHYGRWELDPQIGWIWIPGYEWAPAWVAWGEYGDNYGWAPLGYGMQIGVNISFGAIPYNWWVFGPRRYINDPYFHNYYYTPNRNWYGRNSITIINNIYNDRGGRYMAGPDRHEVERYTRSNVEVRRFDDARIGRREGMGQLNTPYSANRGMDNNLPRRENQTRIYDDRNRVEQNNNREWPIRNGNDAAIQNRNNAPVRGMENRNMETPNSENRQRPFMSQNRDDEQRRVITNERRAEVRNFDNRPRMEERNNNNNVQGNRPAMQSEGPRRRF